ncbi:MAG: mechanosensitive ion channel [Anaerolineae bacterium]|nr:mechanosensitive ion channel [Anaerolineae bacterium]
MDVNISAALNKINDMINGLIAALPNVVIAAIIFFIFLFTASWIKTLISQVSRRSGLSHSASLLMGRLSRWFIIIFGGLIALSIIIPSFNPGQLIQLLGISSIAIGFAFRDIAQNFLAGILILLTQPFKIGDQIVVGDYEGTVTEIETRATIIKTYDGRRVVIPNAELFTDSVIVNTAHQSRRTEYDVGIGYEDDIEQARQIILDALHHTDGVLSNPAPDVLTVALDASSVNLRARWWTKPQKADVLAVQDRVITTIKQKLDENNINIPFPIRTVFFHDETKKSKEADNDTNGRYNSRPKLSTN